MREETFFYDAFISYRHTEPDQFVAENLHKQLEAFRLPKNMERKIGENGRTKINRVFRDRDELPLASNLAEPILEALKESEYLIVICSPRLRESQWCQKEIDTFIKLHDREHVFAVLVEGEPEESFPEQLLYKETEKVQEDGTICVVREPVEPLAADVRGSSQKEILKKIKAEVLRLAAPMFQCRYDDLKQRQRERKLRRIMTASLIGSVIFFLFGAVSTTMALRIQKQKEQIREQALKIEEQYWDALTTQAENAAAESMRLLDEGDRIEAVKTAYDALPADLERQDIPYTPEAEYALADSLYIYENGEQMLPAFQLKHEAEISFAIASPKGDRILSVDRYDNVFLWDFVTGDLLTQFVLPEGVYFADENDFTFLDNDRIVYPLEDGFAVYHIDTGEHESVNADISYDAVTYQQGSRYLIFRNMDEIYLYDTKTWQQVYAWEAALYMDTDSGVAINSADTLLAFAAVPVMEEYDLDATVYLVDIKTGETLQEYVMPHEDIKQLQFGQDSLYAVCNEDFITEKTEENGILTVGDGGVCALDLESSSVLWHCKVEKGYVNKIKADSEQIVYATYDSIGRIDRKTGERTAETDYAREVIDFWLYDGSKYGNVVTRGGSFHVVDMTTLDSYEFEGMFVSNSNNIKICLMGNGVLATIPYGEKDITVYRYTIGSKAEKLTDCPGAVQSVSVNQAEDKILAVTYADKQAVIYDAGTGEELCSEWGQDMPLAAFFVEGRGISDCFALADEYVITLYDSNTGAYLKKLLVSQMSLEVLAVSEDGTKVYYRKGEKILIYDIVQECVVEEYEMEGLGVENYAVRAADETLAIIAENKISLYHLGETEPYLTADVNTKYMSDVVMAPYENAPLFVRYRDETVEAYSTEDLSLIKTYDTIDGFGLRSAAYDGSKSVLGGITNGYLLNEEYELTACISGFEAAMPKSRKILVSNGEELYTVPMYDYQMLLEEAKAVINP